MANWLTANQVLHCLTQAETVAYELSTDTSVAAVRAELGTITDAINIEDPLFISSVDVLIAAGIVASNRRDSILAGVQVR